MHSTPHIVSFTHFTTYHAMYCLHCLIIRNEHIRAVAVDAFIVVDVVVATFCSRALKLFSLCPRDTLVRTTNKHTRTQPKCAFTRPCDMPATRLVLLLIRHNVVGRFIFQLCVCVWFRIPSTLCFYHERNATLAPLRTDRSSVRRVPCGNFRQSTINFAT